MIINKKTHSILTRNDKPNENWTNEECYIINDESELANKILSNYPNIEYVIENNEIIDVKIVDVETITIEEEITAKDILNILTGGVE
jgi:hypothetical protein